MMTINHFDINHMQTIREAYSVTYNPMYGSAGDKEYEGQTGQVVASCVDSTGDETHLELVTFNGGKVYVMNTEGKTVATYNLGGWKRTPPVQMQAG